MRFLKGHGTGNDFVVLPDPDGVLALTPELVAASTPTFSRSSSFMSSAIRGITLLLIAWPTSPQFVSRTSARIACVFPAFAAAHDPKC